MFHRSKPALRTIVIVPDTIQRHGLLAGFARDPRFNVVGNFASLEDAYTLTEAHPPDIVVCTKATTAQLEFPMFEAMLRIVRCCLVTLENEVSVAAIARTVGLPDARLAPIDPAAGGQSKPQRLVAIGASTGGIEALTQVLSAFPAACPPTVIVQHIKPDYLSAIVDRLDRACAAPVVAATDQLALRPGVVALAPGLPLHLEIQGRSPRCVLVNHPPVSGHRPSVDVLFTSVAALKDRAVGVILTGMGRDGATGLAMMRRAGAWTIAQDAATSTVHGMPRVAIEEGAACEVLPLHKIGKAILAAATTREENRR